MKYRSIFLTLVLLFVSVDQLPAANREQSQKFYESALEYFRAEQFSEATIELRNALQKDPNNLPARIMLGCLLLYEDQPRAAIKELEKAHAMGGDENLILIPLARAYMEIAEPEHVITGFVAEGHRPEVDGELLLMQAESYLHLGNKKNAEELFLTAGTLLPVDPRPILGRARIQLVKGKRDKAYKLVEQAVRLAPESYDVWMYKAILHRDHRQFKLAIPAFEKALELYPTSGKALTARAAMWMDVGEVDKAKADLENVGNLNVDTLEAIYLRTLIMFREGRGEEARESLRASADEIRAIKDDYRDKLPNTRLMLGVVAFFEQNYDEAVAHLNAFLNSAPKHPGAKRYLAGAYLALAEYEEVIKLYKPTLRSQPPRDPMALSFLAEAYRATGEYESSEEYLEAALKLAPNVAGIGVRLAMSRLGAGKAEDAVQELERLAARFPDLLDAWVQLARVHVKTGNLSRATEIVESMLERFNGNPLIHNVAGATYLASGDIGNARLQIRLAAELDEDLLLPKINLARLARYEGRDASAIALYRAALERFPHSTVANIELSELLVQIGEHGEAMERVSQVIEREPLSFKAHELKLKMIIGSNDSLRASTALFELVKAFPEDPEAELVAGKAYRAMGSRADAKVHLRRAVEKAHFDSDILFAAANQQYGIGDRTGALWTLTKAEQASPEHLGVGVLKAAVLTELNDFQKANELIEELRTKHGEKSEINTVYGDWYMAQGQATKAVERYRGAFESAPNVRTVKTLFRGLVAANEIDSATALIERWMTDNPRDLGARHLYAQMLVKEKRWQKAAEIYEALQASGVEDIILLNNLAVSYQHLGDPRALPTAEAAYNIAPEEASVADSYGWILTEHGRLEEGLALLRDAYARTSTSPAIRYHIGLALERMGRNAEAQEEVEAALAATESFSSRDDAASLLDRLRDALK